MVPNIFEDFEPPSKKFLATLLEILENTLLLLIMINLQKRWKDKLDGKTKKELVDNCDISDLLI